LERPPNNAKAEGSRRSNHENGELPKHPKPATLNSTTSSRSSDSQAANRKPKATTWIVQAQTSRHSRRNKQSRALTQSGPKSVDTKVPTQITEQNGKAGKNRFGALQSNERNDNIPLCKKRLDEARLNDIGLVGPNAEVNDSRAVGELARTETDGEVNESEPTGELTERNGGGDEVNVSAEARTSKTRGRRKTRRRKEKKNRRRTRRIKRCWMRQ
jgi:hypothetical protein